MNTKVLPFKPRQETEVEMFKVNGEPEVITWKRKDLKIFSKWIDEAIRRKANRILFVRGEDKTVKGKLVKMVFPIFANTPISLMEFTQGAFFESYKLDGFKPEHKKRFLDDLLEDIDRKNGEYLGTTENIRKWFLKGKKHNHLYMFVINDTWDYKYYPMYAKNLMEAKVIINALKIHENCSCAVCTSGALDSIKEIYDLRRDMEEQLNQEIAYALTSTELHLVKKSD